MQSYVRVLCRPCWQPFSALLLVLVQCNISIYVYAELWLMQGNTFHRMSQCCAECVSLNCTAHHSAVRYQAPSCTACPGAYADYNSDSTLWYVHPAVDVNMLPVGWTGLTGSGRSPQRGCIGIWSRPTRHGSVRLPHSRGAGGIRCPGGSAARRGRDSSRCTGCHQVACAAAVATC